MLTAMRTVPVNKPTPAASWALNFFWLRSNTRFHGSYNEPNKSRFSQSMQCSHLGNSELINARSLPVLQSFLTNCRGVEWSVENFNMTKKTQRTHNCYLHLNVYWLSEKVKDHLLCVRVDRERKSNKSNLSVCFLKYFSSILLRDCRAVRFNNFKELL